MKMVATFKNLKITLSWSFETFQGVVQVILAVASQTARILAVELANLLAGWILLNIAICSGGDRMSWE